MSARRIAATILERVPIVGGVVRELRCQHRELRETQRVLGLFAAGHFYSPIPSLEDIHRDAERIFDRSPRVLPGIELNETAQLTLLRNIASYYPEMPFQAERSPTLRYYFENDYYSYSDAICLYGMLRHVKPRHIIEVGSGFSSAVMLDTNERFLGGELACTFIDPYPDRLLSLMRPTDHAMTQLLRRRLQDVDLGVFDALETNDILFIDSSHVLKVGSDVERIFAEILPRLHPGVYIHFHDIFYPFEYPLTWIEECRFWTEAYALRAFLQFNGAFEIVLFNTYLEQFHRDEFIHHMPLCLKNEGGSIWLRRKVLGPE